MTACPKCSNAFSYKYYEDDIWHCDKCGFLGTETGKPIEIKPKEKEITKDMITTKLVIWFMRERKDALPHMRTFPAWEIREMIGTMGGSKSWWDRDARSAVAKEIEVYADHLYLGFLDGLGYVITPDATIAASMTVRALSMMEGWAETLRTEVLTAEDQARLSGVVRALNEAGKSPEDLTNNPSAELPAATVQKLEERIRLLGEPAVID